MTSTSHWKRSLVAASSLLVVGACFTNVYALTLGKIQVDSALGEPLHAHIPVFNLTKDEAESLSVNPASPDVFHAQGATYSSCMTQLQVLIQEQKDGNALLILKTHSPVNDPFLDLILYASWNGGNATRNFTVLLDPPQLKGQANTQINAGTNLLTAQTRPTATQTSLANNRADNSVASQLSTSKSPSTLHSAENKKTQTASSATATAQNSSQKQITSNSAYERALQWMQQQNSTSKSSTQAVPSASQNQFSSKNVARAIQNEQTITNKVTYSSGSAASRKQVAVQRGDTASKIARQNLSAEISLDQMLVAIQQANPNAFINGNINLLRADVSINIPTSAQAQTIQKDQARLIIKAQTKDFSAYRAKLARNTKVAKIDSQAKTVSGGAVGKVNEQTPQQSQADVLKLSNPESDQPRQKTEEALVAQNYQQKEDAERQKEIQDNIKRMQDINDLLKENGIDNGKIHANDGNQSQQKPEMDTDKIISDLESDESEAPTPRDNNEQTSTGIALPIAHPLAKADSTEPNTESEVLPDEQKISNNSKSETTQQSQTTPEVQPAETRSETISSNNWQTYLIAVLAFLLLLFAWIRYRKSKENKSIWDDESPDDFSGNQKEATTPTTQSVTTAEAQKDIDTNIHATDKKITNNKTTSTLNNGFATSTPYNKANTVHNDSKSDLTKQDDNNALAFLVDEDQTIDDIKNDEKVSNLDDFAQLTKNFPSPIAQQQSRDQENRDSLDVDGLDLDIDATSETNNRRRTTPSRIPTILQDVSLDFGDNHSASSAKDELIQNAPPEVTYSGLDFDWQSKTSATDSSGLASSSLLQNTPQSISTNAEIMPKTGDIADKNNTEMTDVQVHNITAKQDDSLHPVASSNDPFSTKLNLAKEFALLGNIEGARTLAKDVLQHGTEKHRQKAQAFLDTIKS